MKIMASGDHHFKEGPRFEECVRVHEWIAERVALEEPDLFISTGDVYDKASTPLERLAAARFFQRIAETCRVIIIRGNHDREHDPTLFAEVSSLAGITVVENAQVVRDVGAAIACCAWPTRLSALDEEGSREHVRAVLRGLGDELAQHEGPRILAGHFLVDGSLTGAGQPLIGGGLSLSLSDLSLARADAILMGHIHRAQEWELSSGAPVLYVGSPYRTDHGEMEDKSIVSLEFGDGDDECGYHLDWHRIPTPARPMILAKGHFVPPVLATDLPEDASVPKADIRLHYTTPLEYRASARSVAEEIRAGWLARGAATVKLEEEVVANTRARAPEVAAARTLPEKIQALWEAKRDVPEAKRAARLLARVETLEAQS